MRKKPEAIFKALGDQNRLSVLQVLTNNELAVSELVSVLRMPQSTVSRHLKTLRDAGLVDARHAGTSALYYPLRNQNGKTQELGEQVIRWATDQPLPQPLAHRLQEVLANRRSESRAFFADVCQRWDKMRTDSFGHTFHLEALAALLPHQWTVADVGTGTGYLLPTLAAAFTKVVAVDPVEEMLAAAKQRVPIELRQKVDFRTGSATEMPLDNSTLDLCIASLVLHHEPAPIDALAEFHRTLKNDGILLIVEQHNHQLADFHDLMQDRWWGFDPHELAVSLTNTGFSKVDYMELTTSGPTTAATPQPPGLFLLLARANKP